jgi:hypothetical protein
MAAKSSAPTPTDPAFACDRSRRRPIGSPGPVRPERPEHPEKTHVSLYIIDARPAATPVSKSFWSGPVRPTTSPCRIAGRGRCWRRSRPLRSVGRPWRATTSTNSQNRLERRPGAVPSARGERHPDAESRWASRACSPGTLLSKRPICRRPRAQGLQMANSTQSVR